MAIEDKDAYDVIEEAERAEENSQDDFEDSRYEDALTVEELLGDPAAPEPDFDGLVTFSIQELFERQITLEGVVIDIITIISDNTDQPLTIAAKLRELLIPDEEPTAEQEG